MCHKPSGELDTCLHPVLRLRATALVGLEGDCWYSQTYASRLRINGWGSNPFGRATEHLNSPGVSVLLVQICASSAGLSAIGNGAVNPMVWSPTAIATCE